jgi:hypothetical protein
MERGFSLKMVNSPNNVKNISILRVFSRLED